MAGSTQQTGESAKSQTTWVPPPPGYAGADPAPANPAPQNEEKAGGRELRQHARRPVIREAIATEVQPDGTIGVSWPCKTVDLSRGGVGLLSRRMAQRGSTIFVRIAGADGKLSEPLYGAVVHVRYAAGGEHQLGICFRPLPAREDIQAWIRANRK